MIKYSPAYLEQIPSLTVEFITFVQEANQKYSLDKLLSNLKNVEALTIDFIHASAQIEGNCIPRSIPLHFTHINIFNSSLANCREYSLPSTRNFWKITFRGVQKFSKNNQLIYDN